MTASFSLCNAGGNTMLPIDKLDQISVKRKEIPMPKFVNLLRVCWEQIISKRDDFKALGVLELDNP